MNIDERARHDAIVEHLSTLIRDSLSYAASEQRAPGCDADRSDETIKDALHRVKELRRIRDEFETLMTEAIVT